MATITRNSIAAEQAAKAASDAARVLQARQQETKAEKVEKAEPKVEANEPESRPDPRGDPERVKARNPIRAASMESIRAARGEKEPEVVENEKEPPKVEQPVSAAQQTPADIQPEKPADAAAAPAEPKIKVKIDGEESEVLQSEIDEYGGVKAYQISKASENRLKKANETLAQAKQMQETLAQFARQQMPKEPEVSDAQFIASKLDAIRFGTPEEGAAALLEIQQRSNPRIDQNMLINQAITHMGYQSAVKQFNEEFKDIVSQPELREWVLFKAQSRMSQLPPDKSQVDWSDFLRRIGNEVRNVVGKPSQPASVPQTTGTPSMVSSDREERKSSIVNLPTAAARATPPEETKPETREESLNRMKKARGIQIA